MSTDRELLDLAAKAVNAKDAEGINISWSVIWECFVNVGADVDHPLHCPRWEPLTDKDDADTLAELLGIQEAEPRAIVRAAAEIGREMP